MPLGKVMLLAVTLTIKSAAVSVAVRVFPTRLDAPAYSVYLLSLRKCESTEMRSRSLKAQSGMGGKGNNGFHTFLEGPKGDKHLHPRFAQLPDREFCQNRKRKEALGDVARLQNGGLASRFAARNPQRPG